MKKTRTTIADPWTPADVQRFALGVVLVLVLLRHVLWLLFFPDFPAILDLLCTLGLWGMMSPLVRGGDHPWRWFVAGTAAVLAGSLTSPPLVLAVCAPALAVACALTWARLDAEGRRRSRRRFLLWLDRHAGYTLAVPLVVLMLFVLSVLTLPERDDKPPIPMKILYEVEPPTVSLEMMEEQPEEVPEPPEQETATDLAATRVNSQENPDAEIVDPSEGDPGSASLVMDTTEQTPREPVSLRDWIPTTEEMAEIAALRKAEGNRSTELQERQSAIREYVIQQEVESAAKDFIVNSDGGRMGAIRLLNVEGFPRDIVISVLKKYGITYERTQVAPGAGRSFLNAAVTNEGTFRNSVGSEGVYEVMVLSSYALSQMAMAETEALQDRGYDPKTARILKIVFGIVHNPKGEYVLGVTELQVEQVR